MKEVYVMKLLNFFAILTASLLCLSSSLANAQQAKGGGSNREGRAASHMSSRGSENTNAQWSADPERGWLRAEERHELHERRHTSPTAKENRGRHKDQKAHSNGTGRDY